MFVYKTFTVGIKTKNLPRVTTFGFWLFYKVVLEDDLLSKGAIFWVAPRVVVLHRFDCVIYKKRVIHRTEIKRLFLTAKGFNTNLVQFLTPYHVIINMHVCSFRRMISNVPEHAPKMILHARKIIIYEGLHV